MNPKDQETDESVYELVCERCGVTERHRLTAGREMPECRCGSPLSPLTRIGDSTAETDVCGEAFLNEFCQTSTPLRESDHGPSGVGPVTPADEASAPEAEYGSLDHPHVEPNCPFCAVRQQHPVQHRVWCAVFFTSQCNCGYERR